MNAIEYMNYLEQNGLIESPQSVQDIANAKRMTENIRNVKAVSDIKSSLYEAYGLNPNDLLPDMLQEKDMYVKLAIKHAYDKEWAMETFGAMYALQLKELKKNLEPTVASIGIIDLKKQMGVE